MNWNLCSLKASGTMLLSYPERVHYLSEVYFLKVLIIFQALLIVMVTLPAGILWYQNLTSI